MRVCRVHPRNLASDEGQEHLVRACRGWCSWVHWGRDDPDQWATYKWPSGSVPRRRSVDASEKSRKSGHVASWGSFLSALISLLLNLAGTPSKSFEASLCNKGKLAGTVISEIRCSVNHINTTWKTEKWQQQSVQQCLKTLKPRILLNHI